MTSYEWEERKEVKTHVLWGWYHILGKWDTIFHGSKFHCENRLKVVKSDASRLNSKFVVLEIGVKP